MAMKPEDVLRAIASERGDAICVPTMTTIPAWRTLAPDDLSVTCVGFMGGASSLALGLALARPERRVIVFDGDGSLLMQLGSLATIAGAAPRNLVHLLFNNGVYHTSGAQEIPGAGGVDFAMMARGAGYRSVCVIDEIDELRRRLRPCSSSSTRPSPSRRPSPPGAENPCTSRSRPCAGSSCTPPARRRRRRGRTLPGAARGCD
jgi:phosphonopyruvate decarboxylase